MCVFMNACMCLCVCVHVYVHVCVFSFCSTINSNPEADIEVQSEDQKSKVTSHWLLSLPQLENLPLGILRMRLNLKPVSSHFIFLSRAGIKGVHHYCPVSMAN